MRETHQPNIDGYRLGDYWMVCDTCGLDYRKSDMKQRWDRAWVCNECWEPQHPQEFVRGVLEKMTVPVARPSSAHTLSETALSATAYINATVLSLDDASGVSKGDGIGITLDNDEVQWVHVSDDPDGNDVTISGILFGTATDGNVVYYYDL